MQASNKLQHFSTFVPVGVTYLDHAGTTLYAKSQVEAHVAALTANLYGNPHSQSPSSQTSTAAVDHVRDLVLRFFGTDSDHYNMVFTSGCTAALKLLSECFPWRHPSNPSPPTGHSQSETLMEAPSERGAIISQYRTPLTASENFTSAAPISRAGREGEDSTAVNNGEVFSKFQAATEEGITDGVSVKSKSDVMRSSVKVHYTRDLKEGGDERERWRVGERGGSVFCYLEDNHTSVVGMREVAAQLGAFVVCTTVQDIVNRSESEDFAESGTTPSECGTAHSESGTANSESGAGNIATSEFAPCGTAANF